ncbi:MAG: hypothetical protein ACRDHG_06235 [Anaerolineales bacterium]
MAESPLPGQECNCPLCQESGIPPLLDPYAAAWAVPRAQLRAALNGEAFGEFAVPRGQGSAREAEAKAEELWAELFGNLTPFNSLLVLPSRLFPGWRYKMRNLLPVSVIDPAGQVAGSLCAAVDAAIPSLDRVAGLALFIAGDEPGFLAVAVANVVPAVGRVAEGPLSVARSWPAPPMSTEAADRAYAEWRLVRAARGFVGEVPPGQVPQGPVPPARWWQARTVQVCGVLAGVYLMGCIVGRVMDGSGPLALGLAISVLAGMLLSRAATWLLDR